MELKKAVEKARQFSGLFLPELHAVQARRRRYRIERLIGFLPPVPTEKPSPDYAAQPLPGELAGGDALPANFDQLFDALQLEAQLAGAPELAPFTLNLYRELGQAAAPHPPQLREFWAVSQTLQVKATPAHFHLARADFEAAVRIAHDQPVSTNKPVGLGTCLRSQKGEPGQRLTWP